MNDEDDIERQIQLTERKSASGDRRWMASCPGDNPGFGSTPTEALADLLKINK